MVKNKQKTYTGLVIGVDGGATKTMAALASLEGRILATSKTGSSSPRNIGLERAMENVAKAIEGVLRKKRKNKKILATFLGLPTIEEEFKFKKGKIKKELLRHKKISSIFKGKVIIGSDQLVGFRSGTDEKVGVVLNAGCGSVAHGWRALPNFAMQNLGGRGKKEAKASGWGYWNDEGSAFWVGQKALQAVWKDLDGRGPKTLITKLIFQQLKIKDKERLAEKIYSKNPTEIIPLLAISMDKASKKQDKITRNIFIEGGAELALAANTVIRKLNFHHLRRGEKQKFPVVLIGSIFKTNIVLDTVKKEIKKVAPQAIFIQPKKEPVMGAVKLAIEQIST